MKKELTVEELRKAEKKGANLAPVDFEKIAGMVEPDEILPNLTNEGEKKWI